MRKKEYSIFIIILFCFLFIFNTYASGEKEPDTEDNLEADSLNGEDCGSKIAFCWAFLFKGENGELNTMEFNEPLTAEPGFLFRILVKPVSNTYFYIILFSAERDIIVIFPEYFSYFEDNYILNKNYFFPDRDNWYSLDENHGKENFYLIVSCDRLFQLESLVEQYLDAENNPQMMTELKQGILAEIEKLFMRRFEILDEKPVPYAGSIREDNTDNFLTYIEADELYIKKITIIH